MLHTIISMHINQFWYFLAEMLLREYATKMVICYPTSSN